MELKFVFISYQWSEFQNFTLFFSLQEVTVGLLKAAMLDHPGSVGYLIDGFPRELNQGELFKQQVYTQIAGSSY